MRINNNIVALTAYRHYAHNASRYARSIERLSSGYRINRAADDPAGLAISEKMRAQIRGLNMAARNCQNAISLVQIAEGALQETHNILQRLRELAVQSASDTNENTIDRTALNREFQELLKEIDDTVRTATFNDMPLLDGSRGSATANNLSDNNGSITNIAVALREDIKGGAGFSISGSGDTLVLCDDKDLSIAEYRMKAEDLTEGAHTVAFDDGSSFSYTITGGDLPNAAALFNALDVVRFDVRESNPLVFQTGANKGDTLSVTMPTVSVKALGLSGVDIGTRKGAKDAIDRVDAAIKQLASQRAALGAMHNRLEYKVSNLETMAENLQAAESRIRDADIAKELTEMARYQILTQTSMAMMAQANVLPSMVLSLLQGM